MSAGMHISTSIDPTSQDDLSSSATTEVLRLKRKLAATHQELDEARGGRPKKSLWVNYEATLSRKAHTNMNL